MAGSWGLDMGVPDLTPFSSIKTTGYPQQFTGTAIPINVRINEARIAKHFVQEVLIKS